METRTEIASMLLQGILANPEVEKGSCKYENENNKNNCDKLYNDKYKTAVAKTAISFADTLIATLDEDYGEWDMYSKKEMWEEIQKVRKLVGSDGTQTICEDIKSYAENLVLENEV